VDYSEGDSSFLAIRHRPEGSLDVGELIVTARASGFAGESSAFFNDSAILAFAARLAEYPLPVGEPPSISGGIIDVSGGTSYEIVGIAVVPANSRGQLDVRVHLAERWSSPGTAKYEVRLQLSTTYERLRTFSGDLTRVVKGKQSEAVLRSEVLA
jgi:hypothetical protein